MQVAEDVYECSYRPRDEGRLSVSVQYAGQPVAASPYAVHVGPVSESPMKAFGPGLQEAVAGFPATFNVQSNDDPRALGTSVYIQSPVLEAGRYGTVGYAPQ